MATTRSNFFGAKFSSGSLAPRFSKIQKFGERPSGVAENMGRPLPRGWFRLLRGGGMGGIAWLLEAHACAPSILGDEIKSGGLERLA